MKERIKALLCSYVYEIYDFSEIEPMCLWGALNSGSHDFLLTPMDDGSYEIQDSSDSSVGIIKEFDQDQYNEAKAFYYILKMLTIDDVTGKYDKQNID